MVWYWHAELGADGKDYRANFVHAPFPENFQHHNRPPRHRSPAIVSLRNRLQIAAAIPKEALP